jgi:hypothetical protein
MSSGYSLPHLGSAASRNSYVVEFSVARLGLALRSHKSVAIGSGVLDITGREMPVMHRFRQKHARNQLYPCFICELIGL